MEVLVSTRNKDKFKEIKKILKDSRITALDLKLFPHLPQIKEDGKTFADNACKKALKIARITKKLTVADDSGLEVDFLKGAPGIYSARFSGRGADYKSNNEKLLKLLNGVPKKKRAARFVCCAAVADSGGIISVVEGVCRGIIVESERGKRGFGYDPIFLYPPLKKTFAELAPSIKNKISHRACAFGKAKKIILKYIRNK